MDQSLSQLAQGNFSRWDNDSGGNACPSGVCRSRSGGVTCAGADDQLGSFGYRVSHSHRHAAVFKRGGWIQAFIFQS